MTYSGASCSSAASRAESRRVRRGGREQRLDQQRMLRDRKDFRPLRLAVPARDPREAVSDIGDFDVERRGVDQVEPAARQHALPGAGLRLGAHHGARLPSSAQAAQAMAIDEMVVDHADRLHEGVDDRRSDEIAAARAQVLGDAARQLGLGGHVAHRQARATKRPAVDEAPEMSREAASPGEVEIDPRQRDRRLDLGAVAHDAGVLPSALSTFASS